MSAALTGVELRPLPPNGFCPVTRSVALDTVTVRTTRGLPSAEEVMLRVSLLPVRTVVPPASSMSPVKEWLTPEIVSVPSPYLAKVPVPAMPPSPASV